MSQKIEEIIIHTSDSPFGSAVMIKDWHTAKPPAGRGWNDIGYHLVVTNGFWNERTWRENKPWRFADGAIEAGRAFDTDPVMLPDEIGAHCYGWNGRTIGACLVGKHGQFTMPQLISIRDVLVHYLLPTFNLGPLNVKGHYEHDPSKTCPDVEMDLFRRFLVDHRLIDDLIAAQAARLPTKGAGT